MQVNWNELLERLAEPFPASAISWRAGSLTRDKKRAQALPYAEPRAYEDRLNTVCPGLWSVTFKPWGESRIICELTIGELTRSSTGEESGGFAPGTSAEAQAFKRACSKFGLGRYLYDIPITWVEYDEERGRLLETPSLPERFLPAPKVEVPNVLSEERAEAMHQELEKLGLTREAQYRLAASVLGHGVERFSALSEAEALEIWKQAKKATQKRAA
jgi:hypothetical protein